MLIINVIIICLSEIYHFLFIIQGHIMINNVTKQIPRAWVTIYQCKHGNDNILYYNQMCPVF